MPANKESLEETHPATTAEIMEELEAALVAVAAIVEGLGEATA